MKYQAERALLALGLDILTQKDLDQWYIEEIKQQPVEEITLPEWEEYTGYLRKAFYIRGIEDFGLLRFAIYYPWGTTEEKGPQLFIEKEL